MGVRNSAEREHVRYLGVGTLERVVTSSLGAGTSKGELAKSDLAAASVFSYSRLYSPGFRLHSLTNRKYFLGIFL